MERFVEGTTFNLLAGFNPMCTDMEEACRLTREGIQKALEDAGLREPASADEDDEDDEDENPYLLHGEELARVEARRKAGINW